MRTVLMICKEIKHPKVGMNIYQKGTEKKSWIIKHQNKYIEKQPQRNDRHKKPATTGNSWFCNSQYELSTWRDLESSKKTLSLSMRIFLEWNN